MFVLSFDIAEQQQQCLRLLADVGVAFQPVRLHDRAGLQWLGRAFHASSALFE